MSMTYVCSTRRSSTVAHLGQPQALLCKRRMTTRCRTSDALPPGRALCPQCAARAGLPPTPTDPALLQAERDRLVVDLLRQGFGNAGIARRLGLATRTTVRVVSEAMTRAGA